MNNVQIRQLCLLAMLGLVMMPRAGAQSVIPKTPIIINDSTAITPAPSPTNNSGQLLTSDQLDGLVARIALYPDVLVAQILPAATYPLDVVEAARWVTENNNPALINDQDWDASVRALAHYPQVLAMMNENLSWTRRLGQAVHSQQQDVLDAIQRLRAKAVKNNALINTPEQTVQSVDNDVEIEPANPNVIYVPQYDPQVIDDYGSGWVGPPLIFGFGFSTGDWFNLDCDWRHHHLYYGGWGDNHGFVHGGGDGNRPWQPGRMQLNDRSLNNYRGWEGNQSGNRVDSTNIARGLSERAQSSGAVQSESRQPEWRRMAAGANDRSDNRNSGTEWHGAFSNYNSGTLTHAYSNRGTSSRSPINRSRNNGGLSRGGGSSGFHGSGRLQSSGRSQSSGQAHGGGASRGSRR